MELLSTLTSLATQYAPFLTSCGAPILLTSLLAILLIRLTFKLTRNQGHPANEEHHATAGEVGASKRRRQKLEDGEGYAFGLGNTDSEVFSRRGGRPTSSAPGGSLQQPNCEAATDEREDDFDDEDGDGDEAGHALAEAKFVPYEPLRLTEPEMVRRSREFYELLNGRRTVRMFSDRPVPRQVVDNIVLTAGKRLLLSYRL